MGSIINWQCDTTSSTGAIVDMTALRGHRFWAHVTRGQSQYHIDLRCGCLSWRNKSLLQLTDEDLKGQRLKDWAYQDTLMEDVVLERDSDKVLSVADQAKLARKSSGQLHAIYAFYLASRASRREKGGFIVDWEDKPGSEVLCSYLTLLLLCSRRSHFCMAGLHKGFCDLHSCFVAFGSHSYLTGYKALYCRLEVLYSYFLYSISLLICRTMMLQSTGLHNSSNMVSWSLSMTQAPVVV